MAVQNPQVSSHTTNGNFLTHESNAGWSKRSALQIKAGTAIEATRTR